MKKLVSLSLVLVLLLGACSALAEDNTTIVDGLAPRKIKIHSAGLNEDPNDLISEGISPTTGRQLDDVYFKPDFAGAAVDGIYQPIMVQISNSNNGVGVSKKGKPYITAPINGTYADIVYEAPQKRSGSQTRMSMIFSDTIPDYVGFVRSTRLTHCRLRQEWDCAFCTSGYSSKDVPDEWKRLGVKNPEGARESNPGLVYVGDFPKVWKQYVWRVSGIDSSDNEVFELAKIARNIVPKKHTPANHTWKFTDDIPAGGDPADIVYVKFGNYLASDSELQYNPETNAYTRYVNVSKNKNKPKLLEYKDVYLENPEIAKVKTGSGKKVEKLKTTGRPEQATFQFNNVIVQSIEIKWPGGLRPDPELVGKGNADYFMCGRHYAGVWERKDINSRTVFYGPDGYEIELQRGKTLIILMDYNEKYKTKEKSKTITTNAHVEYAAAAQQ